MALNENTEILETLGQGSFGVVFVARVREGAIQRTVVLKVLKKAWAENDEVLTRARDEATLLALLNHDSIVKVEQLTSVNGRPTVVMEYVQGLSLDHVLAQQGPFPVGVALSVVAKVAGALDAAYNTAPPGETQPLRVIHRDIKPSNIMMSVSGAVKVLDFGTARAEFGAREAMTQALTLGSPLYMAPECFDGAPPAPEVDVYALGATLYELLTGTPLGRLSIDREKHTRKMQERLAQLQPPDLADAPQGLAAIRNLIARMVRYDSERRPTSRDVRRLCREFARRIPRLATPSLDQFAEVVVEPLFRQRKIIPPVPLEGTMDPSASGGSSASGATGGHSSSGLRSARSSGGYSSSGLRAPAGSSGGFGTPAPGTPQPGSQAWGTPAPSTPAPGTPAPSTPAPGAHARGTPAPSTPPPRATTPSFQGVNLEPMNAPRGDFEDDAPTVLQPAGEISPTEVLRPSEVAPTETMSPEEISARLGADTAALRSGGGASSPALQSGGVQPRPLPAHDDPSEEAPRSYMVLGVVLGLLGVLLGLGIVYFVGHQMKGGEETPELVAPHPRSGQDRTPADAGGAEAGGAEAGGAEAGGAEAGAPSGGAEAPSEPAPVEPKEPAPSAPSGGQASPSEPATTPEAPSGGAQPDPTPDEVRPAEAPVETPAETPPKETPPPQGGGAVTVRVVSMPAGADIRIAGQSVRTPGEITVPAGGYSAAATFPDGTSATCKVTVGADGGRLAFRSDGSAVTCP